MLEPHCGESYKYGSETQTRCCCPISGRQLLEKPHPNTTEWDSAAGFVYEGTGGAVMRRCYPTLWSGVLAATVVAVHVTCRARQAVPDAEEGVAHA
jgi:hypothetical protein